MPRLDEITADMVKEWADWLYGEDYELWKRWNRNISRKAILAAVNAYLAHATPPAPELTEEEREAIAKLTAQRDELLAVVVEHQWSGHAGGMWPCCPDCCREREEGHSLHCQLAAAIRNAKPEEDGDAS